MTQSNQTDCSLLVSATVQAWPLDRAPAIYTPSIPNCSFLFPYQHPCSSGLQVLPDISRARCTASYHVDLLSSLCTFVALYNPRLDPKDISASYQPASHTYPNREGKEPPTGMCEAQRRPSRGPDKGPPELWAEVNILY